jgi:hypothetical protein
MAEKSTGAQIFKWLTIGFLGTLSILCLTVVLLVWRFTPLIGVDEKTGRVTLLGGLVDLNGAEGNLFINGKKIDLLDNDKSKKVSGAQTVDTSRIHAIQIPFGDGKITMKTSSDKSVHWDCRFDGRHGSGQLLEKPGSMMMFDFGHAADIKCEIEVPKHLKTYLEGNNGHVELEKPENDVELNLTNGKVSIEPKEGIAYHYDLKVDQGVVQEFKSSNDPHAVQIKMKISNGAISKE